MKISCILNSIEINPDSLRDLRGLSSRPLRLRAF